MIGLFCGGAVGAAGVAPIVSSSRMYVVDHGAVTHGGSRVSARLGSKSSLAGGEPLVVCRRGSHEPSRLSCGQRFDRVAALLSAVCETVRDDAPSCAVGAVMPLGRAEHAAMPP